jgi:hypothetical protein
MKNYFKINDLDVDENGQMHDGYAIIETPNTASNAMRCFLAGYLSKNIADVSIISKSKFKKLIKEDGLNEILGETN